MKGQKLARAKRPPAAADKPREDAFNPFAQVNEETVYRAHQRAYYRAVYGYEWDGKRRTT